MTDGLDARPERRLSAAGGPAPVEDDTIQSLAEEIEEDEERGGSESDAAPFDLGIPEPRAIDLRKVWKLAGQKPDAQILAALGPNVPVLLSHSITAFPVGAGKPPRVWGIRYGSQLFGIDARTVSVQPTTELLDVLTVGAEAELAVGLAGELSVPDAVGAAIETVPGVALNDARVAASLDQSAKLRIRFTLVRAEGDRGYGGARRRALAAVRAGSPARRPPGDAADAARPEGDQAHPGRDRRIGGGCRLVRPSRVALRDRDLRPGPRRAVTLSGRASPIFRAP